MKDCVLWQSEEHPWAMCAEEGTCLFNVQVLLYQGVRPLKMRMQASERF